MVLELRELGLFVTFEGPDGSGKTTQAQLLYEYLQECGYPVFLTREPGGTGIGDQIREVLHSLENTEMLPQAEILLYSASRAQLVGQIICPHLDRGEIVLCDRYADSTLAYQGYGHGLDLQVLRVITSFATGGLKPDLTIYLDIEVEEGRGGVKAQAVCLPSRGGGMESHGSAGNCLPPPRAPGLSANGRRRAGALGGH
jgi:dTMP kinase